MSQDGRISDHDWLLHLLVEQAPNLPGWLGSINTIELEKVGKSFIKPNSTPPLSSDKIAFKKKVENQKIV